MSKLLTPQQAAVYLNVSINTLVGWRKRNVGPAYLRLDNLKSKRRGPMIRYRLDDIEAFHQRVDAAQPDHKAPPLPVVTDAQWQIVESALRWEQKMGRLWGVIDRRVARAQMDQMLRLALEGLIDEAEGFMRRTAENEDLVTRWVKHGWLEIAFRALADDPTFKFTMIKQTLVMPHQPRRSKNHPGTFAAARLHTDLIGPIAYTAGYVENATPAHVTAAIVSLAMKRAYSARTRPKRSSSAEHKLENRGARPAGLDFKQTR